MKLGTSPRFVTECFPQPPVSHPALLNKRTYGAGLEHRNVVRTSVPNDTPRARPSPSQPLAPRTQAAMGDHTPGPLAPRSRKRDTYSARSQKASAEYSREAGTLPQAVPARDQPTPPADTKPQRKLHPAATLPYYAREGGGTATRLQLFAIHKCAR